LAIGVGALQIVLERGQTDSWFSATYICVLTALSVLCLSVSAIMTFILGFGLFSAVFVFPLFAQRIIGYTAFQTGLMLLPGTLLAALISPFLGKLMQKGVRPQYMVIAGFLLTAMFNFWISRSNLEAGFPNFIGPLILRGLGASLLIVPLTALAVSELAPKDIPHRAAYNRNILITHVGATDPVTHSWLQNAVNRFLASGSTLWQATQQALAGLENTVVRQTFLLSYMDAFLLLFLLNAVCIPLVFTTIRKKKAAAGPPPVVSDH
jgi:MFS transporter, DHA2 family, multidrug resistance protein